MSRTVTQLPSVCAIIPTWNSGTEILSCLDSLLAQKYANLHIVVVDNGSKDGTPQSVAAHCPSAEILHRERNTGFAEGCNLGIRHAIAAGAEYILLLNDDTELLANGLPLLVTAAETDPRLGIVGPAVISRRNPHLMYAGARVDWRTGNTVEISITDCDRPALLIDTEYVPGCALLIKSAVVRQIGLLDERYFLYYEDVDWCLRSADAGYRCAVAPMAVVRHANTVDARTWSNIRSLYYPRRSHVQFLRSYRHRIVGVLCRRAIGFWLNEHNRLTAAGNRHAADSLAGGLWDGLFGVVGPEPHRFSAAASALFSVAARLYAGRKAWRTACERVAAKLARARKDAVDPTRRRLARSLPEELPMPPSTAVIGYISAANGMGEAARGTIVALSAAQCPVHFVDIDPEPTLKAVDLLPALPELRKTAINLLHVNAVNVTRCYEQMGASFFRGKHNIGFWFWEMPTLPRRWYGAFSLFDEIWVASRYTQAAIAAVAPVPVVCMRPLVQPAAAGSATRKDFGIPDDRFVFLFCFDALSILERKNPQGTIAAFRRAFGAPLKGPLLVVKVNNSDRVPGHERSLGMPDDYMADLTASLAAVNGVLLDQRYDRSTVSALIAACDCYVSLHRCEGFGLTMAEAMYFGKPCIATGYSGNLDFMTPANSYLVGYRLTELERDWGPYEAGDHWAEPDIDHAAELMQAVYADLSLAAARGLTAASDIAQNYGIQAVGSAMRSRLQLLALKKEGFGAALPNRL